VDYIGDPLHFSDKGTHNAGALSTGDSQEGFLLYRRLLSPSRHYVMPLLSLDSLSMALKLCLFSWQASDLILILSSPLLQPELNLFLWMRFMAIFSLMRCGEQHQASLDLSVAGANVATRGYSPNHPSQGMRSSHGHNSGRSFSSGTSRPFRGKGRGSSGRGFLSSNSHSN
jgi:hypothetical protein